VEGGAAAGFASGVVLTLLRLVVLVEIALIISRLSPSPHSTSARVAASFVWVALKFPAFLFVGQRSLAPGFDAAIVALGITTHLAYSIGWGVLFGIAATGLSPRATVALGLLWGIMGATAEVLTATRLLGGHHSFRHAGVTVAFLVYGVVLARTFLRFERRKGWPLGPPPRHSGRYGGAG
jgi:hypothetical protein